ncbi:serine/arginine repetitive matrix protein 1-like isoform X2 [Manis pentadactyla]|uniref:serine/arginine repetitive matrix protein 1-like isoform X2 n=1 Tax=Manis pentadactyla TaxID=143292 RepID=UPI00255CE494|nr:serine/arginine repetitive matrix protein 1-like isoform X2 [Manis pentadactyla]XP_057353042.1 serine/arginine repetitive matrix protein 1-like isoform X2 [Manis pentadactyla]
MSERRRGAGSHWARAQVRRMRSSYRRRRRRIQESVASRAPSVEESPAAPSVLRSGSPVSAPPVRRSVRAAGTAEPRWWTRAVLGCAFLPPRRRRRHRPCPPASDLLAPAGLPAPQSPLRASPAAGGGRHSARTWSRRRGRTCARPARPLPAWRRRAARPGPPPPPRGSREGAARPPQRVGQPVSRRQHLRKAAESPAGKRLPPPRSCGGASRASPASGVKKTATALRVGRKIGDFSLPKPSV